MKKEFYAHGKLLLTGEYAVLDGAKALGLPTKLGQRMTVKSSRGSDLVWKSKDVDGNYWFETHISLFDFSPIKTTDEEISKRLKKILKNAVRLNSEFLDKWNGFKVETELEFPIDWGLGSSSSLISMVSSWADVNPLMLHFRVSNGSGCDVACAIAESPILYISSEDEVSYVPTNFSPSFKNNLYFVHLGTKQNTEAEVKNYLNNGKKRKEIVSKISSITDEILKCNSLSKFESLLDEHENIISSSIERPPIKSEMFPDYWGSIKSLGAWGGDFILASSSKSEQDTKAYFASKGLNTFIKYDDLIL